jgi:SAM-dependent methyltransferase
MDVESVPRTEWTDEYVRRYQDATYGASHQRAYLQRRSETLAALLDECRIGDAPLRVLEVACGPGLSLDYLSHQRAGHRLTGIDTSLDMLRQAALNLSSRPSKPALAQASARELPFSDGSFDLVYATRFIHLFRNKAALAMELQRVTRRSGLIVIEFYSRPYHLLRYLTRQSRVPFDEFLSHHPSLAEVRRVMGPKARFIPLRFGGERWLRRMLGESRLRRLLAAGRHAPLRAALSEYFAVIRRA